MRAEGHHPSAASEADVIIVNTCGFIDEAKQESIDAILDAAEFARARGALLAAVGCLVERYHSDLAAEIGEVDFWCGLDAASLVRWLEGLEAHRDRGGRGARRALGGSRPVSSYVKISDGCDRRCAFCAIPLIKGDYETVPPADVLASARAALAAGAKELALVGQDTSRWDEPGWGSLDRLLAELSGLGPASTWLRLLYLQPEHLDERVLAAIARYAVPYVDVPLQHASGAVLRRMRRGGDGAAHLALLQRVRAAIPGAAVRSTFITGFPGETDSDFDELLAFVREAGIAVAGVFVFDAQEGTEAASLPDQIPLAQARERAAVLGEAIEAAAAGFWHGLVGGEADVLVEAGTRRAGGIAIGRLAVQAPDVDGRARVRLAGGGARRGDLLRVRVTAALGYDVEAETVAVNGEP